MMFFFFSYTIEKDEFLQIIEDIKSGRSGQPKFEKAVNRLVGDSSIHNNIIKQVKKRLDMVGGNNKYEFWNDALSVAYMVAYDTAKKFNGKTKEDYLSDFRKVLSSRLMNFVVETVTPESVSIGRSTKENHFKVKKFIRDYKDKNRREPTVKEISKATGFSESRIRDFLQDFIVMKDVTIQDLTKNILNRDDGKKNLEDFMKDDTYNPEVIFQKRELKRNLQKAIQDFLQTIRGSKIYDGAARYLNELLEKPYETQKNIQKRLNLTQRQGQLIWQKFLGFMRTPKYRKLFIEASRPQIIVKLAALHAQHLADPNKEQLLKNIVTRVVNDRRSL